MIRCATIPKLREQQNCEGKPPLHPQRASFDFLLQIPARIMDSIPIHVLIERDFQDGHIRSLTVIHLLDGDDTRDG
jgi:hypothetical protein